MHRHFASTKIHRQPSSCLPHMAECRPEVSPLDGTDSRKNRDSGRARLSHSRQSIARHFVLTRAPRCASIDPSPQPIGSVPPYSFPSPFIRLTHPVIARSSALSFRPMESSSTIAYFLRSYHLVNHCKIGVTCKWTVLWKGQLLLLRPLILCRMNSCKEFFALRIISSNILYHTVNANEASRQ